MMAFSYKRTARPLREAVQVWEQKALAKFNRWPDSLIREPSRSLILPLARSLAHSHLRSCWSCMRPAWDLVFSFPSRTHVQRVNIILCCSAKAAVRCWINHCRRAYKQNAAQPGGPAERTAAAPIPNGDDVLIYFFCNRAVPRAIKLLSCVGLDALGCARDPKSFSLLEMCYSISQSIMNHRQCGFWFVRVKDHTCRSVFELLLGPA